MILLQPDFWIFQDDVLWIYTENRYPLSHQVGRVWVLWRIKGNTLWKHEIGYNQKSRNNSDSEYTHSSMMFFVQALRILSSLCKSYRPQTNDNIENIEGGVKRGRSPIGKMFTSSRRPELQVHKSLKRVNSIDH